MTNTDIRAKIHEMVGEENYEKLTPELHAILDEGIEAALAGNIKINDHPPETENEILLCVVEHFKKASTAYEGLIRGVKELANEEDKITIQYRGQTFTYKGGKD